MDQTYFTDQEYRILLQALYRERTACEKVDDESKETGVGCSLTSMVDEIGRKIKHIQYHYHDVGSNAVADQKNMEDKE